MKAKHILFVASTCLVVAGTMLAFIIINVPEEVRTIPTVVKPDHSRIVQWVYARSAKISHPTAVNIVDVSMGSPRGYLILAVCEAESNFTPTAVSSKGAIGLGQIMYEPHKDMLAKLGMKEKRDLFDIEPNLKATDTILAMYLNESKGNIEEALRRYLGGRDGQYVFRIFKNFVELSLLK